MKTTLLLLSSLIVLARAASPVYLTLDGIKGEVSKPNHEDTIRILGFSHEVVIPRDAASGLPTGKRQHKPVTITKRVDIASPLLLDALSKEKEIETAKFEFLRPNQTGDMAPYYTIELLKVRVTSVSSASGRMNNDDVLYITTTGVRQAVEEVEFIYDEIVHTHLETGTVYRDTWEASVQ
jgi:type VI secretion system secreted protein Hcp